MAYAVTHDILDEAMREDWSRFDLAASCYSLLQKSIPSEQTFLSTYCADGGSGTPSNPNLPIIRQKKYVYAKMLAGDGGRFIQSGKVYGLLQKDLDGLALEPYKDEALNELTLLWLLIMAIDLSCVESGRLRSDELEFPLNHFCRDDVGVYFSSYTGFINEHLLSASIEAIPELTFNGQLDMLLFYRPTIERRYPNLVVARQGGQPSRALVGGILQGEPEMPSTQIRIGLEQFSGASIFGWEESGAPLSFVCDGGQSFVASYSERYTDLFYVLVREAIDNAVDSGCDILLFPEYVMAPALTDAMSSYLSSLKTSGSLKLVVAGSGWVDDSDNAGGDNVCVLYTGRGRRLGCVYKRDPFIGTQTIGGVAYTRVEHLSHPGEEITVVDVPGIGRVATAICRDLVSDDRYPLDLARDIGADIVCVPALSNSLDRGFGIQLDMLSERNLSIGCVCNLCCARVVRNGESQATVSCVSYPAPPSANPKQPEHKIAYTYKTVDCLSKCSRVLRESSPHSCLWTVDIVRLENGFSANVERYSSIA